MKESRGHSLEFDAKDNIKRPSNISIEDYENEEHLTNRNAFANKEKTKIVEWLHTLEKPFELPRGFSLSNNTVEEFKDGILLCKLVETLEGIPIENV